MEAGAEKDKHAATRDSREFRLPKVFLSAFGLRVCFGKARVSESCFVCSVFRMEVEDTSRSISIVHVFILSPSNLFQTGPSHDGRESI